jgi:hypothetical protein
VKVRSISANSASSRKAIRDTSFGKVVDEVEDFAEVAADPVEGVQHDHIAGSGVGQQAVEAVAVDGGAGLLVDIDLRVRDAGRCQRLRSRENGQRGSTSIRQRTLWGSTAVRQP